MKSNLTKRKNRIENKKKKMAALLEITKLNEYDRAVKNTTQHEHHKNHEPCSANGFLESEPSPKRLCTQPTTGPLDVKLDETSPQKPQETKVGELLPNGRPLLSIADFLTLKKELRSKTQKMRQQPRLKLRELGDQACLAVEYDNRTPIFLSDLQHLIMYTQVGPHSPYTPARWCSLDKFNRLANTNVIIFENLSLFHFTAHESTFPFLSGFEHKLEVLSPSTYKSDIIKDVSMVPLTGGQMRSFTSQFGTLEKAVFESKDVFHIVRDLFPIEELGGDAERDKSLPDSDNFPRTQLLLSGWQMVEENFPLPIKGLYERKYSGYVLTKDKYREVSPSSPMFGLDCEMCKTSTGDLELTRVSVVSEQLEVFYDTLVKPKNRIVDYLTRFSGITPKMMQNIKTELRDVQEKLRSILPDDAILVGQSLSNDMHALKMMHPYVIDTSVIFNITGDRQRKTKLQTLAREFLSERIQEGRHGHCSTEDSNAAMKLTQLKLSKSLSYGDALLDGFKNQSRIHPEIGTNDYATSMLKQATKADNKALVVGSESAIVKYKYYVDKGAVESEDERIKFVQEKSNGGVMKRFCEKVKDFNLNVAHLRLTESELADVNGAFGTVDRWIKEAYDSMLAPGLSVVLFGGQADAGNGCCFLTIKKSC